MGILGPPFPPAVPHSKATPDPQRLSNLMTAGLKLHSRDQRGGRGDTSVASPHVSVGGAPSSRPEQEPDDGRGGIMPEHNPDDDRSGSCELLVGSSTGRESSNMVNVDSVGDIAVKVSVELPAGDQLLMDLESGFGMEVDKAGHLDLQQELLDCIDMDAARDPPARAPQLLGSGEGSAVQIGDKEACEEKNVRGGVDANILLDDQDSGLNEALPTQDFRSILIEGPEHEMNGHKPCTPSNASCQDEQIIIENLCVECSPIKELSAETPIRPHKEQSTETQIETPAVEIPLASLQPARLPVSQDDDRMGSAEKIEDGEKDLTVKEGTGSTASQNAIVIQKPVASVSCDGGSCIAPSVLQGEEATFSHTGSDNQVPSTNEVGHGIDVVVEHVDIILQENTASECSSSTSRKFVEDANANHANNVTDQLMEDGEIEDGEIPDASEDVDPVFHTETGETSIMEKSSAEKSLPMDTARREPGGIFTHSMNATNSSIKNHVAGLLDYGDLDWLKDETETVKPMATSTYKKGSNTTKVEARDENSSPNNLNLNDGPVKMTIQKKEKSCKSKNGEVRKMTEERKAKKKIAKKRKRAETNKKLGVKRLKIQPVSMPKKVVDCKYYLIGRCREGEACKFSHDKTPVTKSKPCEHFIHDRCLKGDDCPYDHELSKYPCHNFTSKGSCIRGAKCKFSHEISAVENVSTRNAESKTGPSSIQGQPSLGNHVRMFTHNSVTNIESPLKTSTSQISMDKPSLGEAQIGARTPQKPPKGVCFLSFERKPMEDDRKARKSLEFVGGLDSETCNWPKQVNGLLGSVQRTDRSSTLSNAQKLPTVKSGCDIVTSGNKKPLNPSTLKNMTEDSRIHKSGSSTQSPTLSPSASTQSAVTEASRLLQEFLFLGGS